MQGLNIDIDIDMYQVDMYQVLFSTKQLIGDRKWPVGVGTRLCDTDQGNYDLWPTQVSSSELQNHLNGY